MSDHKFLSQVYDILKEENVFEPSPDLKYVEFQQPKDLQQLLDLQVEQETGVRTKEVEEICRQVIKYSIKINHPYHQNELYGGYDPFALAASWITSALNTTQFTYEAAPVFTLIEEAMLKKCMSLFGFAENSEAIFCPGGSQSNMYGIVMARQYFYPDIKRTGVYGMPTLVAYTSEDGHYSIGKSMNWLGLGLDNLVVVKANDDGRMNVDDLERNILIDIKNGKKPFFVNATAGTTLLGSVDDLEQIADICEKYNIWLHADATLGGHAMLSQKYKHIMRGVERVDSLTWTPQKTLGAGLQCCVFLMKYKDNLLTKTLASRAIYLFQPDKLYDISYDRGDKSIQCGKSIDSFKLWLMFKARGMKGLEESVDRAFDASKSFQKKLLERDGFRLVIPEFQYTNTCFWYIPKKLRGQPETEEWWSKIYLVSRMIKEQMQTTGKLALSYNSLPQRNIGNFLRLPIKCFPPMENQVLDYIIEHVELFGESVDV